MLRFDRVRCHQVEATPPTGPVEFKAEYHITAVRSVPRADILAARDPSEVEGKVETLLKLDLWREAYGGLQGPFNELLRLAKIYVRPEDQNRLRQIEAEIRRVMGPPVPLPEESR